MELSSQSWAALVLTPYKNHNLAYILNWELYAHIQAIAWQLCDHIPCTGGAESLFKEEMGLQAKASDGLGSFPDPPSLWLWLSHLIS